MTRTHSTTFGHSQENRPLLPIAKCKCRLKTFRRDLLSVNRQCHPPFPPPGVGGPSHQERPSDPRRLEPYNASRIVYLARCPVVQDPVYAGLWCIGP